MATNYSIYALSGPDLVVRYVGKTRQSLHTRALGHVSYGKYGDSDFAKWINDQGAGLTVRELERVSERGPYSAYSSKAADRETWWIAHFIEQGNELFNRYQLPPNTDKFVIIKLPDGPA